MSSAPQSSAHQSPAPQRRARSTRDLRAATLHVAARLDELGLLDPAVSASVREHVARPARGLREAVRAIASYPADHDERLLEPAAQSQMMRNLGVTAARRGGAPADRRTALH